MNIMSSPRRASALVTLLAFLTLSGCYAYSPVEEGRPRAGDNVRLELSHEGTRVVGKRSVLEDPSSVEGLLTGVTPSAYRLLLTTPARRSFRAGGVRQDTLSVPTSDILRVEAKRLQTAETIALTGTLTLGAFVLGAALASGAGGGGGSLPPSDGGGDVTIVIPLSLP